MKDERMVYSILDTLVHRITGLINTTECHKMSLIQAKKDIYNLVNKLQKEDTNGDDN